MNRADAAVPTKPTMVTTTRTGRNEPLPVITARIATADTPTMTSPSRPMTRSDSVGPATSR
jgi:hypothetical protein